MAAIAPLKNFAAKLALTGLILSVLGTGAQARGLFERQNDHGNGAQDAVAVDDLPSQAQKTYRAIFKGGPFPHEKDGAVFGNRERLLPRKARGHYREYTVDTPGMRNRGVRRIVCGGAPTTPSACWYTADHYASFRRIEGTQAESAQKQ